MAARFSQLLECPICMETFTKPKVLQCQHSFCLQCIFRIYTDKAKKQPSQRGQVACPLCKKTTLLVSNKVKEKLKTEMAEKKFDTIVPNNFTLISMLDFHEAKQTDPSPPAISRPKYPAPPPPKPAPAQPAEVRSPTPEDPPAVVVFRRSVTGPTTSGSSDKEPTAVQAGEATAEEPPGQEPVAMADLAAAQASPNQPNKQLCNTCQNQAITWWCLICDDSVCGQCLAAHLEKPGDHEPYDIEEERRKMDAIAFQADLTSTSMPDQPLESAMNASISIDRFSKLSLSESDLTDERNAVEFLPLPSAADSQSTSGSLEELPNLRAPALPMLENTVSPIKVPGAPLQDGGASASSKTSAPVSPPPVPPRNFPRGRVVQVLSPQTSEMGRDTPSKVQVDSSGNIFVSFAEANIGIRKFSANGELLFRFARVSQVLDICLDSKKSRMYVLSETAGQYAQFPEYALQSYCSNTGNLIKVVKNFGNQAHTHVSVCRRNANRLFLFDAKERRIRTFNVPKQDFGKKVISLGVNLLRAMESSATGGLYIIAMNENQDNSKICYVSHQFNTITTIPIIQAVRLARAPPTSIAATKKHLFIAYPTAHRVAIYDVAGKEIEANYGSLTKADVFSWLPTSLSIAVDGANLPPRLFVTDTESESVFRVDIAELQ